MPAYPEEFKSHIINLVKYVLSAVNHTEWDSSIEFVQKDYEADGDRVAFMRIWCDDVYLNFDMQVTTSVFRMWKDGDYSKIGGYVCHEVCHLLTQPLKELLMADAAPSQKQHFMEVVERQTQRIANVLRRLLPDEWYMPEILKAAMA
jgi:hypothetical protein